MVISCSAMHFFTYVVFLCVGVATIAALPQRSFSTQSVIDIITKNQEAAWAKSNTGYVLYTPDTTGWGNQCRGMSASVILALLTNRRFLINDKERPHEIFFNTFNEPSDKFSIRSSNASLPIDKSVQGPESTLMRLGKSVFSFKHALDRALISDRLILHHGVGGSFAAVFLQNKYRENWQSLFGKDIELRWDEIEVAVMWWLFQNPGHRLLDSTNLMMKALKWHTFDHQAVVQYRSWQDAKKLKNSISFPQLVSCVKTELQHLRKIIPAASRILVYITSDDREQSARLRNSLGVAGPNMVLTVHELFSNVHSGMSHHKNVSVSASQGLVDWYLLGQVSHAVCSGTSYCASARARTGVGRSSWSVEDLRSAAPFNDVLFPDIILSEGNSSNHGNSSNGVNSSNSGNSQKSIARLAANLKAAGGVTSICPATGNFLWIKPPYSRALTKPNNSVAWFVR